MEQVPRPLLDALRRHSQEHVLAGWHALDAPRRARLVEQLERLDLAELADLYRRRDAKPDVPDASEIEPLPRSWHDPAVLPTERRLGEAEFARGAVAFLVVAGGQGTRLGFDHPKGMFPIGPVTGKSLFQIHAEKILGLSRRFGARLPLLVMTSPATHAETVAFFEAQRRFGLAPDDVRFFEQRTMPALCVDTGQLLLEDPGQLFLSPNGHGGVLTGLAEHRLLDWLGERDVRTVSYFQVDNPLVKLADYAFLGRHVAQAAEVSLKVLPKIAPTERVGNVALVRGRCGIIEYSDMPREFSEATDGEGGPVFWAGNPAIHLFDVGFLARMADAGIPWHVARKRASHLGTAGAAPERENALKFERFIFDVLPEAQRWSATETTREDEFEPLKNAEGRESPATVRQALVRQAARWLEAAGVSVPRLPDGDPAHALEIGGLFALEPADLAGKVASVRIDGPHAWG